VTPKLVMEGFEGQFFDAFGLGVGLARTVRGHRAPIIASFSAAIYARPIGPIRILG
jgi:hypothetical protein